MEGFFWFIATHVNKNLKNLLMKDVWLLAWKLWQTNAVA